jgi:hypothetical protein
MPPNGKEFMVEPRENKAIRIILRLYYTTHPMTGAFRGRIFRLVMVRMVDATGML